MADQTEFLETARNRADQEIDAAIGALRKVAREIGEKHHIPENIAGHSIEELLGRMAYIPTMARDLRRACAQEMAKGELDNFLSSAKPNDLPPAFTPAEKIEPSKIPDQVPISMPVDDLSGVTTQTVKALKEAGLFTVGDVAAVPDAHLLKFKGIAEKSLAQVRAAIAKASGAK